MTVRLASPLGAAFQMMRHGRLQRVICLRRKQPVLSVLGQGEKKNMFLRVHTCSGGDAVVALGAGIDVWALQH